MKLWNYMENGGTRAVEVAHRRWGKDDCALHYTAVSAFKRIGNYWHLLPKYDQARKSIWDAVNPRTSMRRIDEAFPPELRTRTRNDSMFIEFRNGSTWQLVGSDNYNAIVGSPPVGLVLSEWALADPMAWAYLSPILEENGGWAMFVFTSRGDNHGKTTYENALKSPKWFAERLTALDTPVFSKEQLDEILQQNINMFGTALGTALYSQEYMCDFAGAVMGAYYASALVTARAEGRVTSVPWDPGVEVDTFWDLGLNDAMAIWFMQPRGQSYHWIDYYEGRGFGMEHYANVLKEKPYVYGNHWMPHDAKRRELSTGIIAKTVKQTAEDLGIKPVMLVDRARNMDVIIKEHIPAGRNAIARSWFDEQKCYKGLAGLENYRAEYDEKKKKLGDRPLHDWTSNPADAFRTFAAGYKVREEVFDLPIKHYNAGFMGR
jgi:phage terminase large subunit